MKGSYILVLRSEAEVGVEVGRLGLLRFAPGYYAYCGSALGGLEARVARHFRRPKKPHWHVDYVVETMDLVNVWKFPGIDRRECLLNHFLLSLPGSSVGAAGFGSSDCRCVSHLVRLPTEQSLSAIEACTRAHFDSWLPVGGGAILEILR